MASRNCCEWLQSPWMLRWEAVFRRSWLAPTRLPSVSPSKRIETGRAWATVGGQPRSQSRHASLQLDGMAALPRRRWVGSAMHGSTGPSWMLGPLMPLLYGRSVPGAKAEAGGDKPTRARKAKQASAAIGRGFMGFSLVVGLRILGVHGASAVLALGVRFRGCRAVRRG